MTKRGPELADLVRKMAHRIRDAGNDAAHPDDPSWFPTEAEAREALAFFETVMDWLYVLPARLAEMRGGPCIRRLASEAMPIEAILHTDPGCPWAYSALPALRVLDWRYGPALRWRLVLIGLSEDRAQYEERGYTPGGRTLDQRDFRDRFGMPFAVIVKPRLMATSPACRAIVAARIERPGSERAALRALQLANFTAGALLDDPEHLKTALAGVPGINPALVVSRIDDADVREAYQRDRAEARSAAGSPAQLQGKTAKSDGPVRYTAPSLVLRSAEGRQLVAGGWQTIEAYDVLVANLDPEIHREGPPRSVESILHRFPEGVTTQEAAALMTRVNDDPDRPRTEAALIGLVAAGRATRTAIGDDAIWRTA